MIPRSPESIDGQAFDLIVIGGGIFGVALTLEAARAGLRPLMVERDDFGQHTSSNWLRFIHGGLRHLQRMDLLRHHESVRERRWFLATFPDLVEPIRCVMPLYGDGARRRWIMAGALLLNDVLSAKRNRGVRPDRRIPRGMTITPFEVQRIVPGVDPHGLEGGAIWYDAIARKPQRVLMEMLRWGTQRGATALNYVEGVGLLEDGGKVRGIRALDTRTGRALEFSAPAVLNCAGPWCGVLARHLHEAPQGLFRPSLAFNVQFDRPADFEGALAVTARRPGARTYFLHPWAGGILAGTYHVEQAAEEPPNRGSGSAESYVGPFVKELAETAPWLRLAERDVVRILSGQLPVRRHGSLELVRRNVVHDHEGHGGPKGLFSISGVKYTLARRTALRVLSMVERRGLASGLSRPTDAPPSPRTVPDRAEIERLVADSPAEARGLLDMLVSEEAVLQESDLFLRRTSWGDGVQPSPALTHMVREAISRRSAEPEE